MITVEQARAQLQAHIRPIARSERLPARSSAGRVLFSNVVAAEPNPRFTNSALDGYCVMSADDAREGAMLRVVGEISAGDAPVTAADGEALRVFTGAPLPSGAYAVAYQEESRREGDYVVLQKSLPADHGIRYRGEDYDAGDVILRRGDSVNAGAIALLAAQGAMEVEVFASPLIGALVTGSELSDSPGEGQIFDSCGPMLEELILRTGCNCQVQRIVDDYDALRNSFATAAAERDAIVVSGGASVGDYDYVERVVAELGHVVFHKVAMKPGKPFLFGEIEGTPVFGLPGNPSSAFVTFTLFVRPALMALRGETKMPRGVLVRLVGDHETKGREEWIRCILVGDGVAEPVGNQGSFGLRSLAYAEAIVQIPANTNHVSGELRLALLV